MNEHTPNHFIENFKKRLENVKNKEHLIQNEIYQIQAFTSLPDKNPQFSGELNFANETNSVFDLMHMGNPVYFNSVFNEFLIDGKVEPILDFKEEGEMLPVEDGFLKEEREEAISFVNYYLWLKKLQNNPKQVAKTSSVPHKQKMLVLYYLGLETNKYDKVNLGKLLSTVLELSYDNTRKYLSYVSNGKNEVRTLKNLNAVKTLFDTYGLTEISNQIQKDIESMK